MTPRASTVAFMLRWTYRRSSAQIPMIDQYVILYIYIHIYIYTCIVHIYDYIRIHTCIYIYIYINHHHIYNIRIEVAILGSPRSGQAHVSKSCKPLAWHNMTTILGFISSSILSCSSTQFIVSNWLCSMLRGGRWRKLPRQAQQKASTMMHTISRHWIKCMLVCCHCPVSITSPKKLWPHEKHLKNPPPTRAKSLVHTTIHYQYRLIFQPSTINIYIYTYIYILYIYIII